MNTEQRYFYRKKNPQTMSSSRSLYMTNPTSEARLKLCRATIVTADKTWGARTTEETI